MNCYELILKFKDGTEEHKLYKSYDYVDYKKTLQNIKNHYTNLSYAHIQYLGKQY